MSFEAWAAFAAASTALLLIPGPTVLLVVSYALGQGWRQLRAYWCDANAADPLPPARSLGAVHGWADRRLHANGTGATSPGARRGACKARATRDAQVPRMRLHTSSRRVVSAGWLRSKPRSAERPPKRRAQHDKSPRCSRLVCSAARQRVSRAYEAAQTLTSVRYRERRHCAHH